MRDKPMLIGEAQDETTWRAEYRNHMPANFLGWIPYDEIEKRYEDVAWLQIETVVDELHGVRQIVTVNQPQKDAVLQQRLDESLQKETEKEAKKAAKRALKQKAKDFKVSNINGLPDIRNTLADLMEIVDDLMTEVYGDTD